MVHREDGVTPSRHQAHREISANNEVDEHECEEVERAHHADAHPHRSPLHRRSDPTACQPRTKSLFPSARVVAHRGEIWYRIGINQAEG